MNKKQKKNDSIEISQKQELLFIKHFSDQILIIPNIFNGLKSEQQKLLQSPSYIQLKQFITKKENKFEDITENFDYIYKLIKKTNSFLVFNLDDLDMQVLKFSIKKGYDIQQFIVINNNETSQNKIFKQLKDIKKLYKIQTMIDLTIIFKLQFTKDISSIVKYLKKNAKYIDFIILSDIKDRIYVSQPFDGDLFNYNNLQESIQLFYFLVSNFNKFVLPFDQSDKFQKIIHQYKNNKLSLIENLNVIYHIIIEIIMQNEKLVQYITNQYGDNEYLFEDVKDFYKNMIQLLHIIYDISSCDMQTNILIGSKEWQKYNIPDELIQFIIVSNISIIKDKVEGQVSNKKSTNLKYSYKTKQLLNLRCLISCRKSLKDIQKYYVSGDLQKRCKECVVNQFTIEQLNPIIEKINDIMTADNVKIPYEICGSIRRGRVRGINNVNIIIHEEYNKLFIQRLLQFRKQYQIMIFTNLQFINFQMKVEQTLVRINVQLYDNDNYGIIKLFETGNIPFNYFILYQLKKLNFEFYKGSIRNLITGSIIKIDNEEFLFKLLHLQFIPPQYRTSNKVSQLWKLNVKDHQKQISNN